MEARQVIIPRRFKIGGHEITVRGGDAKYELSANGRSGEYHPIKFEIRISDLQSKTAVEETYFHEVIEAINSIYDLELPHNIIQTLGIALHQVQTTGEGIFPWGEIDGFE